MLATAEVKKVIIFLNFTVTHYFSSFVDGEFQTCKEPCRCPESRRAALGLDSRPRRPGRAPAPPTAAAAPAAESFPPPARPAAAPPRGLPSAAPRGSAAPARRLPEERGLTLCHGGDEGLCARGARGTSPGRPPGPSPRSRTCGRAPPRSAPLRPAPPRSAPLRPAPPRSAPLRPAPPRSAPLRPAPPPQPQAPPPKPRPRPSPWLGGRWQEKPRVPEVPEVPVPRSSSPGLPRPLCFTPRPAGPEPHSELRRVPGRHRGPQSTSPSRKGRPTRGPSRGAPAEDAASALRGRQRNPERPGRVRAEERRPAALGASRRPDCNREPPCAPRGGEPGITRWDFLWRTQCLQFGF
ncbi:PREDICTED: vegetative cell wall protein gp1-like [Chinchilla lanigera]|uniref:vegetative cell wall protein gp1-like n=1 Tax=Chinchilla lanigera TaxID=34839 RepID=UPI0006966E96|nr:PREDICTED: vegetative cell wall protein gp1-like [Chinchilla lanigera]